MEANNKQQYINKDGVQDCYIETLRVKTKDQALRNKHKKEGANCFS